MSPAALTYYVAQSLDGFIADTRGGVGFLDGVESGDGEDYGYAAFYAGVDSLVMGRGTYAFVEAYGSWPYPGKPTWVMTSGTPQPMTSDVRITGKRPAEVLADVRAAGCRRTWLVGGGKLAAAFVAAGLVDEWIVSVVPYVMGEGIPLVGAACGPRALALVRHTVYPSGLVQLVYRPAAT